MAQGKSREQGFTLIELSIVLVIIGLIVGGILVGQDLIKAAEVRAQISQIEKYNSAVNTFRGKFNAIPGDMAVSTATQFGFVGASCSGTRGARDGNGLLEGVSPWPLLQTDGELALFWQDISSSIAGNLIDGQFPNSGAPAFGCVSSVNPVTTTPGSSYIGDYLPLGKIGHGTFVYVYSNSGSNWYGLSTVSNLNGGYINLGLSAGVGIPVVQAYSIDNKIDDGLPTTGAVQAIYVNSSVTALTNAPNPATDTTTSCYNTTSNVYSIGTAADYGAHGNCALSFRFQ
jgi:prepilin-type N-terminal cleavage/methylation domain-containing protein